MNTGRKTPGVIAAKRSDGGGTGVTRREEQSRRFGHREPQ